MANIDWQGVEKQTVDLARLLLKGYVKEAASDARSFQARAQQQIAQWLDELRRGEITEKNFASLVRGERDLAEMMALKQTGLAQIALDTFINGFIEIVLNAAIAAI